jgi:hypothetical protein
VAEHSPRVRWIVQELQVPISVSAGACVLLRAPGLKDVDCIGLDDTLLLLPVTGKRSHRLEGLSPEPKRKRVELPVSSSSNVRFSTPSIATSSGATPLPEVNGFPLLYVCDMRDGMQVLQSHSKEPELTAEFCQVFSGMEYYRSTVRAACTVFRRAMSFSLVDEFVSYGRTNKGKWSALRDAVNMAMRGEHIHYLSALPPEY